MSVGLDITNLTIEAEGGFCAWRKLDHSWSSYLCRSGWRSCVCAKKATWNVCSDVWISSSAMWPLHWSSVDSLLTTSNTCCLRLVTWSPTPACKCKCALREYVCLAAMRVVSAAVVFKLWYARAFQVVREQLSCRIRKALLIRFCVIIRSCVMLMLLIRLFAILILSTFWANYVLLKPGVYTPTLKNIRWYAISKSLRTTDLRWLTRAVMSRKMKNIV